jgi:hypothetical protein
MYGVGVEQMVRQQQSLSDMIYVHGIRCRHDLFMYLSDP